MNETPKTKSRWRIMRGILITIGILATLAAIFYTEEDWRGKRAWENCKRELEAKGAVLDWNKYIPPSVPDDQNFFTTSTNIYLRFVKLQTDEQGDAARYLQWLRLINYFSSDSNSFPILDFAKSNPPVVAEISFATAKNDSTINLNDPAAHDKIQNLIRTTIGRSINGAQGFQFSEFQLDNLSPAKIILQADTPPSIGDLENLIPSDLVTNIGKLIIKATVDPKIFQVKFVSGRITSAADYLKWSDQFESAFDEIREALKRPYAIIPGDYSKPWEQPIPNFVTMRALAQTLAQRAQCDFLIGKAEDALREVTLMHDVCRILEKPPTGQPETLVEAMINVAITGLYTAMIQDGFRFHAWQEPQLAVIQAQLAEINLPSWVESAFAMEQTGTSALFNSIGPNQMHKIVMEPQKLKTLKQKIRELPGVAVDAAFPSGWKYQNLVVFTRLIQVVRDSIADANHSINPKRIDQANNEVAISVEKNQTFLSPFHLLASIAIPNSKKTMQTCAYNQTLVNEGQIACALERYKLANGNYPETLDALVPQLIEKIPHDIIGGQTLHYRRKDGGKFLLYSVGWNEMDDGGQENLTQTKGGSIDYTKGDWVWKN
jgi:hypothetical protein